LPGAESCIGPVELGERVERRLGRSVFVSVSDAIVVIEGFVSPRAGGFDAVLRVSDQHGQVYGSRELRLEVPDCRRLDELAALVIAVTIHAPHGGAGGIELPSAVAAQLDALFADEPRELDPASLPSATRPNQSHTTLGGPQAASPESQAAMPGPDLPGDVSLGAGLGLVVASGLQPHGTLAAALHVRLGLRSLGSLVLAGWLGLRSQADIEDPTRSAASTISFQLLELALSACAPDLRLADSALSLCAQAGVGRIHAQTSGFVENGEAEKAWFELGPEGAARVALLGPLYVRLAARLPFRVSRPRFDYARRDGRRITAFLTAPVGVGGELALGADFF
jgi:hypothetical protein